MNWRKITFVVVGLIVLLGGAAALSALFSSMKPEPPRMPDTEIKRYVKAQPVVYSEVTSSVIAEGRVVSSMEVSLVSEASGKIEPGKVALKKGTSFKKGDLIATIYKDEVELALKARKSLFLTSFTNMLPDIKIDYPEDYPKFQQFFNDVNLDEALPEMPVSSNEKVKIFLSSRNILSEYYGILQDEKRLERHSFVAPFDGAFTQVNYEVGAFVNVGGMIARMIRTDQLEIEVPVENGKSKWIKIGDKVTVLGTDGASELNGKVVRKSGFVDEGTQSRSIFVKVAVKKGDELLTGEYKKVLFSGQNIAEVMEMPRSAVFNTNEVFTVVDGRLKKQTINVVKVNDKTLIFNGIGSGEELVVEPLINVKDNLAVEIIR